MLDFREEVEHFFLSLVFAEEQ
jgi:hypothetical protein